MCIDLVWELSEVYVDLFLIYLLYKFMNPQRALDDGRNEASVLIFAHDPATWFKFEEDKNKAEELQRKHDDFFNFVVKEWTTESSTE